MRIRNQLVRSRKVTSGGGNPARYITVHETANRSRGANAQAHANLQSNGNVRQASWHIQVDDREAIRSYPDSVRCWHAGDGGGPGNMESIGIEICVNADGDYDKALANAAAVIRQLRAKHGIPASRVVQHNHWSGKNCPTILRGRGAAAWRAFVASTEPTTPAGSTRPTVPSKPPTKTTTGRTWFDMATKKDLRDVVRAELKDLIELATKNNHALGRLDVGKGNKLVDLLESDRDLDGGDVDEIQRALVEINEVLTKNNHALGRLDVGKGKKLMAEVEALLKTVQGS